MCVQVTSRSQSPQTQSTQADDDDHDAMQGGSDEHGIAEMRLSFEFQTDVHTGCMSANITLADALTNADAAVGQLAATKLGSTGTGDTPKQGSHKYRIFLWGLVRRVMTQYSGNNFAEILEDVSSLAAQVGLLPPDCAFNTPP